MGRFLRTVAFLCCVLLILLCGRVAAQDSKAPATSSVSMTPAPDPNTLWEEEQRRRSITRRLDEAVRPGTAKPEAHASFYNRKLTGEQKKLLEPSPEEMAAHRDFLRQEHTGLIRLLPRGKYEFNPTVAANQNADLALPIRGGGAFYSFAEKQHSYGPWSEISLQEGRLIVGFLHQSLGVMTMLGNVPIESLTLTTPSIAYLAQLVPPTEPAAARDQCTRYLQGFTTADHLYSASLPALINQTYALRSTVYKKEGRILVVVGGGAVYVPHPYEYGGADELIVFRVLRAAEDGGLTILWKRLQKFSPPKIRLK
jgi:hypothetical protein